MIKRLLISFALLALVGCVPSTVQKTDDFVLPSDLEHCKIVRMSNGSVSPHYIYLIKCPAGTVPDGYIGTSSSQPNGKTRRSITTMII